MPVEAEELGADSGPFGAVGSQNSVEDQGDPTGGAIDRFRKVAGGNALLDVADLASVIPEGCKGKRRSCGSLNGERVVHRWAVHRSLAVLR